MNALLIFIVKLDLYLLLNLKNKLSFKILHLSNKLKFCI